MTDFKIPVPIDVAPRFCLGSLSGFEAKTAGLAAQVLAVLQELA